MRDNASPFYKGVAEKASAVDVGLRSYMLKVYNYMGGGLLLTGLIAYLVSSSPTLLGAIFSSSILRFVCMLAPLGIVIALSFKAMTMKVKTAQALFWTFAVTMGVSLSSIFVVYTGMSIATTFFVTTSMFLSMSIYGYVTDADLSKMGNILIMGLFGLIIASLVNLFTKSGMMNMIISGIGVLIFTGLTAYDSQKIKEIYLSSDSTDIASKKAILGALSLYLDFINLFLYLLRFLGRRAD